MSRWCLGLFASAVSTWCLHRLGMCSVAPKIVLCGCVSVAVLDCFNLIMWLPKVT